ncbi:MAG TPA: YraN family protein [Fimbriiglobus sp.]
MAAGFARWPWTRRWFGRRSERAGARFLRRIGYRILAANWDDRKGEIDLLALDRDTIVVVEVRSTESADLSAVAATVNSAKQKRLSDAAVRFLQSRRLLGATLRFDVLAVRWPAEAKTPEFLHLKDAFPVVGKFQFFN